jgi:hypothetical protein
MFLEREPHDSIEKPPIDLFGTMVFASCAILRGSGDVL